MFFNFVLTLFTKGKLKMIAREILEMALSGIEENIFSKDHILLSESDTLKGVSQVRENLGNFTHVSNNYVRNINIPYVNFCDWVKRAKYALEKGVSLEKTYIGYVDWEFGIYHYE